MRIFSFIMLCLCALCFIILPGIHEYNTHKDDTKIKALLHAIIPLLFYIAMALTGFILFEIVPRIVGPILDNIF